MCHGTVWWLLLEEESYLESLFHVGFYLLKNSSLALAVSPSMVPEPGGGERSCSLFLLLSFLPVLPGGKWRSLIGGLENI